ncbi:MAG: cadmium-translocating P-type ATPase [Bryobacterales bacterium]|nr:cadmium-translocating P-type ATPase [Bryobacterales bacterium]
MIRNTAEFRVHGLDCAEEVLLIRKQLSREQGIHELNFDVVRGKMVVDFDPGRVNTDHIQKSVSATGLKCEPWSDEAERAQTFFERHGRVMLAAISGTATLAAMIYRGITTGDLVSALLAHEHAGHHMDVPVVVLCLIAIAAGSWFILPKAWHSLRRVQPDMNALVVISLLGAAYLGEWVEGATLAFLFALAALLETYSLARARNAVTALMQFAPGEASVVHHDHEHRVPVAHLKPGAVVRVRPGERIPCDGEVVSGASDVNQAMITGEALPSRKAAGDTVYAGTMNGDGLLDVRSTRAASDTTLARIVRMVEGVQHRRAPSEQFVEKFSRYYTPAVMMLALLVAITPPLLMGKQWGDWFYQGMVILLISCPCALVISTPVSIVAALASAARQGVLVKGGAFLEEAARLRAIAFDKTGVLTTGEPAVRDLIPLNGFAREEVLARLAALESRSQHPMARAVARYAKDQGVTPAAVDSYHSIQGKGAEGSFAGEAFWVGSLRLMKEKGLDTAEIAARLGGSPDTSIVACGTDREAWAVLSVTDTARPEAREAVAALRTEGIDSVTMLTGDNRAAAERIAREVGVDSFLSELLPDDKATAVARLKQTHGTVAMVGDGVNDAQAMAASTLGVAMASSGMDVVMETADVVLISGGLGKLAFLLRHARRTASVIRQNIAIALVLKVASLVAAFFGVATLWMAVAADMGATLLVTFNGLRLLRAKP